MEQPALFAWRGVGAFGLAQPSVAIAGYPCLDGVIALFDASQACFGEVARGEAFGGHAVERRDSG
jgi:hypothetical protein